jgi:hypothetical protein
VTALGQARRARRGDRRRCHRLPQEDFTDGSRTFDVVVAIGGMTPVHRPRRTPTGRGTLVIVGGEGGARMHATLLSPFVSVLQPGPRRRLSRGGVDNAAAVCEQGGEDIPDDQSVAGGLG